MTSTQTTPARAGDETGTVDLLIYSDDVDTRRTVIEAVGRRAAKGLPLIRWTEAATHAGVLQKVADGDFALLVLDGEAAKVGGMAVSRQLKSEIYDCPPILLLIARPQDAWLATWSEADAYVSAPLDPIDLQEAVARLLREQAAK
ncbi:response regulator transcription factor [Georgenia yuyongxinii]|uniref:Response regulatory domain-containing protein n=1 Tax=Georgenia yuyongxinii TaxID=2589797 RepID=A0A552WWH6_9MICO|nr:response regulator transcription factor [Georgenia yuyongxinii]TRW47171.1 hypothetical protein FJ693_02780 [Georgenia yuyongxinii]